MIDKIVITLDDCGKFVANFGDMHVFVAHTPIELMREVNNHLRKLAYLPTGKNDFSANPIPYDKLKPKK